MRIVGVRLSPQGETFAAALPDDDGPARILAPLAAFWAAPSAALSTADAATVPLAELVVVPPVLPGARVVCVDSDPGGGLGIAARWPASLAVSGTPVPIPADHDGLSWAVGVAAYVGAVLVDADEATADAAILGFSAFADLAAVREVGTSHAVLARNGDSTGPLGALVTREQPSGPGRPKEGDALRVTVRVDDRVVVDGEVRGTRDTLVAAVALVSRSLTLRPGDLVVLGVSETDDDAPLLRAGGAIEVHVEGLGSVHNPVIGDERRAAVTEPH